MSMVNSEVTIWNMMVILEIFPSCLQRKILMRIVMHGRVKYVNFLE
jgi:hypothetical protein